MVVPVEVQELYGLLKTLMCPFVWELPTIGRRSMRVGTTALL